MREAYGIILAGGQARRLGGVDKALIAVGGEPILTRLARRLGDQCVGLALNANGDPARFAGFGLAVVADDIAGFAGPLAGVLAGMEYVAANFAADLPISSPSPPTRPSFRVISWRGSQKRGRRRVPTSPSRDRASAIITPSRYGPWPCVANCGARWWRRNCVRWLLSSNDLSTSRWSGRPSLTIHFSTSIGPRMWSAARRWRLKHSPDQSPRSLPATAASAASARARTPD